MRTSIMATVAIALLPLAATAAFADYAFITQNPYATQKRLFDDIRRGSVDKSSVGPRVIQATTVPSPFSSTPEQAEKIGDMLQICLSFGLSFPSSHALVFRTLHRKGCGEWVIEVTKSPEMLTGLVFIPIDFLPNRTDSCGAPGVLPPIPPGGTSFQFPRSLSCRSVDNLDPISDSSELDNACAVIPGFCQND